MKLHIKTEYESKEEEHKAKESYKNHIIVEHKEVKYEKYELGKSLNDKEQLLKDIKRMLDEMNDISGISKFGIDRYDKED